MPSNSRPRLGRTRRRSSSLSTASFCSDYCSLDPGHLSDGEPSFRARTQERARKRCRVRDPSSGNALPLPSSLCSPTGQPGVFQPPFYERPRTPLAPSWTFPNRTEVKSSPTSLQTTSGASFPATSSQFNLPAIAPCSFRPREDSLQLGPLFSEFGSPTRLATSALSNSTDDDDDSDDVAMSPSTPASSTNLSPIDMAIFSARPRQTPPSFNNDPEEGSTMECDDSSASSWQSDDLAELARIHTAAFDSLRKSTARDEEGFLATFREREAQATIVGGGLGSTAPPCSPVNANLMRPDKPLDLIGQVDDDDTEEVHFVLSDMASSSSPVKLPRERGRAPTMKPALEVEELSRKLRGGTLEDYGMVRDYQERGRKGSRDSAMGGR